LTTFVLLIALVAIAFGGSGYLYGRKANSAKVTTAKTAATTTNTTGWETYTNNDYGYQISYPPGWKIIKRVPPTLVRLVSTQAQNQRASDNKVIDPYPLVDISVSDFTLKSVLDRSDIPTADRDKIRNLDELYDYFAKNHSSSSCVSCPSYQYSNLKKYNLGSTKFYELGRQPVNSYPSTPDVLIFAEKNNFFYQIDFTGAKNLNDFSANEKEILASFKFTSPQKTKVDARLPEATDWTEYKNDDLGVKLTLPVDWQVEKNDNSLSFYSPADLAQREMCNYQYCEIPGFKDFSIAGFQSLDDLQKNSKQKSANFDDYLKVQAAGSEIGPTSLSSQKIGQYDGYKIALGGFCSGWNYYLNQNNKFYTMNFYCHDDDLNSTEQKILDSMEIF